MGFVMIERKFYNKLDLIAQHLGVTAGNLQDAINMANQANEDAENMIADLEERWAELTTEEMEDQEVIDARTSTTKAKTFASLNQRLEEAEQDFATMAHGIDNAGFHNSIYRGKNLGDTPDYANIANGKFTDMFIGDYYVINGRTFIHAGFDYFYNAGDTALTQHHAVLIPAANLYSHVMNDTNTTAGGYTGSKMYAEGLDQAKDIIHAAFPGHVVTHRRYLCNAVSSGQASAGAWVNSDVCLMNEVMVYGSVVNGYATYGLYNIGIEKSQLPLFALNPQSANIRATYWLRDVCSASYFARVNYSGYADPGYASFSFGVRPAFSIS